MPIPSNVALGNLVIKNLPDLFCFTSARDLVANLPELLGVETPLANVSNVVVGVSQPDDSQTNSVWFRYNNAGSFVGIYVFSGGKWVPLFPVKDSTHIQTQAFSSEDGTAPAGWTEIRGDTPGFPPGVATALAAQAIDDPTSTFRVWFWAYYTGV